MRQQNSEVLLKQEMANAMEAATGSHTASYGGAIYAGSIGGNGTRNDADLEEPGEWLRTFRSCVILLLATAIVIGNLLVIASVVRFPSLRCNTNWLIVSLSVTDLFVGLVILPLLAYVQIATESRPHLLCYVISHAEPMICFVALLHIVMLNVERYISIEYPLKYHVLVTKRVKYLLIASPWALAAAETVVNCLFIDQQHHSQHCRFYPSSSTATVLSAILTFLVPLVILCVIYVRIAVAVRRHLRNQTPVHSCSSGSVSVNYVPSNGVHHSNGRGCSASATTTVPSTKHYKKTLAMVTLIVGTFTICWGPYVTVTVLYSCLQDKEAKHYIMHYLIPLTELMVYTKSVLNPWIYAFCCQQFRRAFRILCKPSRVRRDQSL